MNSVYPRRFDELIVFFFCLYSVSFKAVNLIFCCQKGSGTYYHFFGGGAGGLFSYIFVFITCFEVEKLRYI